MLHPKYFLWPLWAKPTQKSAHLRLKIGPKLRSVWPGEAYLSKPKSPPPHPATDKKPVVYADKKSVVFADSKSVASADKRSVVSADNKSVLCQDIPMVL